MTVNATVYIAWDEAHLNAIRALVFNTLDFCGKPITQVKRYCAEHKLKYDDSIERIIFDFQTDYFEDKRDEF